MLESNRHVLDLYWRKLLCINEEDARIYGDFNSIEARQINIQLKKCRGSGCKTDEQIKEFFSGKYLMLLVNEARFVTDGYNDDRVDEQSRVIWQRVNTYQPTTQSMTIQQTDLVL